MAKEFEIDDLVWAKMKGFPPWPAKITQPREGNAAKSKKPQHFVFFFGTHDVAWILDELIYPHSDEMLANSSNYKKKSGPLQKAIEEIKEESISTPKKVIKEKPKVEEKDKVEKVKSSPGPSKTPKKTPLKKKVEKKPKKRPASEMEIDYSKPSCSKVRDAEEDYAQLIANVPPNNAANVPLNNAANVAVISPYDNEFKKDDDPPKDKPKVPIAPSNKKFGFLGLGVMGSMMVTNLLKSKHNVTVWNRTSSKCEEFKEMGAKVAESPAEVIRMCDITFCCLSDAEAAKDIVFSRCGVLEGFASGGCSKGYVEMTSIDPTTAQEISEAIIWEGGRYLEAPMVGKRQEVEKSSILVLGAGDRSLFVECDSCFNAFGKHNYYLGGDIGLASKMNVITGMVYGTTMAALAESLALIDKCGIHPVMFMNALVDSPLSCDMIFDKGHDMITNNQTVEQPIKHVQNGLDMAVQLSNNFDQPLRLASAVNESLKRARCKNPEGDVASIYQIYKFDEEDKPEEK